MVAALVQLLDAIESDRLPSTPAWKAMGILWFKNRRGVKTGAAREPVSSSPEKPILATLSLVKKAGPSSDNGKRDGRPKLSGWIPGPVLRRCTGCDEKYLGDVRSKSCADCSYGCAEAVRA